MTKSIPSALALIELAIQFQNELLNLFRTLRDSSYEDYTAAKNLMLDNEDLELLRRPMIDGIVSAVPQCMAERIEDIRMAQHTVLLEIIERHSERRSRAEAMLLMLR